MSTRFFSMTRSRRRSAALLSVVAYSSMLALTACGGGGDSPSAAVGVSAAAPKGAAPLAAAADTATLSRSEIQARLAAQAHASDKLVQIAAAQSASGTAHVTVTLPTGASAQSVKMVLNGRDVSMRLQSSSCDSHACLVADLTAADGVQAAKNVVYATAQDAAGAPLTGRLRFGASVSSGNTKAMAMAAAGSVKSAAVQALPTASSFLPPSIGFKTLAAGGPSPSQAWIQVGSQQFTSNCQASDVYTTIVLDRQTLQGKSSLCFADGAALAAMLKTLDASDLAIVSTTWENNADGKLDTSAIGGFAYTNTVSFSGTPQGYMAIGVGGASPATAYQSYYTAKTARQYNPFANGTLVEDINGNYNFTPTNQGPLEYSVTPNDAAYANTSTIRLSTVQVTSQQTVNTLPVTKTARVYSPPQTPAGSVGGFWLMQFHRDDMSDAGGCASGAALAPIGQNDVAYPACGTFYNTGSSDLANVAQSEATRLANDLAAIGYQNLAVLTTVGRPFDTNQSASINSDILAMGTPMPASLQHLGAPSHALQMLTGANAAFTLVSSLDTFLDNPLGPAVNAARPNFRQSMNGDAVVSIAIDPNNNFGVTDQGQTGAVRGVLLPDLRGLYEPSISTQSDSNGSGTDLAFHEISMLSPVDWPELSTVLFNGQTTVEGQRAAYAYLSYYLITQAYLPGFVGPYANDIHYFFTGGLNSHLDVRTMDPVQVPFPPGGLWHDPVANVDLTFTSADKLYVAEQLKSELIALSNVLSFMSTGSRNMKDMVAGGQNSAALALISAAARIEASTINPPKATPTTLNYADFMNFFGGVTSIATTILGAALPEVKAVGIVGGILSGALWSGGSLGFSTPGTSPSSAIPNAQRSFLVSISDLANGQMQSQMAANFDATLDLVVSDYNKLMAVNGKVLDSGPDGWYAAREGGEAITGMLMGKAAERSFYLSLLPAVGYSIDAWTAYAGTVNTDSGGLYDQESKCAAFYPKTGDMPANSFTGFLSAGQTSPYAQYDIFVLGGLVTNAGSSKYSELLPGADLSTYIVSPSGLGMSSLVLFDFAGPIPSRAGIAYTGFSEGCYPSNYNPSASTPGGTGELQPGQTRITLDAPTAVVAGGQVTLTAHAVAGGNASTTGGTVLFTDGSTTLGTATIDQNGDATLNVVLGLGAHSLDADFVENSTLRSSSATAVPTVGYAGAADFTLQVSNDNLTVGDATPIQLQIGSRNGFAGSVKFSCTGLPEGMECQFGSESVPVDLSGGTTTLKIVPAGATSASLATEKGGSTAPSFAWMLALPLWLRRRTPEEARGQARRLGRRLIAVLLAPVALSAVLVGCGGGGSDTGDGATQTKTVLVTATDGKTSHSIPVKVTVRK